MRMTLVRPGKSSPISPLRAGVLVTLMAVGAALTVNPALARGDAPRPGGIDDLFADDPPAVAPETGVQTDVTLSPAGKLEDPVSLDALFDAPVGQAPDLADSLIPDLAFLPDLDDPGTSSGQTRFAGFYQNDLARTLPKPSHWSKFRNIIDVSATGRAQGGNAWKLGARVSYDPIYDLTNHYNSAVRKDQRLQADIREAYVDISADDWQFRLGRQHIIWGEMAGLFFADVVSAKDIRELALPEFDILRIPQWAMQAEYYSGDLHAQAIWIPYMTYNDIGKPGAEFYPFPLSLNGFPVSFAGEKTPRGIKHSAYGARISYLKSGWDMAGFVYSSMDAEASFKQLGPLAFRPIHERIHQVGATLGKDLGAMVLKAEAVYTLDKRVNVNPGRSPNGLLKRNVLDYIVGLEWSFPQETRFGIQAYQRWFPNHDDAMWQDATSSGVSLSYSTQALHPKLEPKILLIRSLDQKDWLAQLRLTWRIDGNWRAAFGADLFGGDGLFGRFDKNDRVYSEVRYTF